MRIHPLTIALTAVVAFAFLQWFPAPESCGCAERKRRLARYLYGA